MEEFNVFFSFQTDSPESTNFHFLRDLIKDVCKSIKHYKVDFDYGFYNSSGNRPLAEHMLSQSEKADVFIGDITYTSEYNSHKFVSPWWSKEYKKIEEKGRVKKYPNANVMLETGYSWALKKYQRTILLFNTAYGNMDEDLLPADMLHIQRPTTYFLNEESLNNSESLNHTVEQLKGAIKKEILKVIEYEREYLSNAFSPIYLLSESPISHVNTPYYLTRQIEDSILIYRKILEVPGNHAFLEGKQKYGKERFAFELFRKNSSKIKMHNCFNKSYYHNFQHGPISAIHESVQRMIRKKQHFVLIMDQCSDMDIETIEQITFGSLLSVFYLKQS
jgi:hypothetical protein